MLGDILGYYTILPAKDRIIGKEHYKRKSEDGLHKTPKGQMHKSTRET